jgi:hypothetical protein
VIPNSTNMTTAAAGLLPSVRIFCIVVSAQ